MPHSTARHSIQFNTWTGLHVLSPSGWEDGLQPHSERCEDKKCKLYEGCRSWIVISADKKKSRSFQSEWHFNRVFQALKISIPGTNGISSVKDFENGSRHKNVHFPNYPLDGARVIVPPWSESQKPTYPPAFRVCASMDGTSELYIQGSWYSAASSQDWTKDYYTTARAVHINEGVGLCEYKKPCLMICLLKIMSL